MSHGFVAGAPGPPPEPPSAPAFIAAVLVAFMLLLGLGMWAAAERAASDRARILVRQSYERRHAASELLVRLNEAESAQRGYVIVGRPAFLAPYRPARQAVLRQVPRLAGLYRAQPTQAARIAALRGVVAAKIAEMDAVIATRDHGGLARAALRVADSRGRLLMERARDLVMAVGIAEDEALRLGIARADATMLKVRLLIGALLATVCLAALATALLMWRSRRERFRTQARAHEALVRLRGVFASTTDAIVILNPSGTIEDINPAASAMLGFAREELGRRDVSRLLALADGDAPFEQRIGIVDGRIAQPIRVDQVARHRDGREIIVDVALGLMPLEDGAHVVASLRDVSERKAAERLKDQFISTVSHELRTPLTSVLGALGLLRGGAAGGLSAKAARLIEIADNNARRLIRLINDILDIDRIGAGEARLALAPLDLRDVARRAVDDAYGLAAASGVGLDLCMSGQPVPVLGDGERLLQVLGNLLSNAIRFSPAGTGVTLNLAGEGRRATLCVTDRGPGVPAGFRDRLFERFAQSDAGAAIAGGSGLGLAISREIAHAHGGELSFEDAPGGGARFCLWLPLHDRATAAPAAPSGGMPVREDAAGATRRVPAGEGAPTLLHIDDDPDMLDVLAMALAGRGRMLRAESLAEARAILATQTPDIIILDLNLGDGSGLDLLPELFAPDGSAVPTIIYSACDLAPELERQVDAVLVKSRRSLHALSIKIGEILDRRHPVAAGQE